MAAPTTLVNLYAMVRGNVGSVETKASHEVMELVRANSALSYLAMRLRDTGMSWPDVKAGIEAEIGRNAAARAAKPKKTSASP